MPNLQTARSLVASGHCERVLSICVEVCSAAFYLDDDAGVLISACLFGDGAGAAVLSAAANGGRRVQWKSGGSLLKPADRDRLRFEQKNGMLRNILTPEVPALAAQHVGAVLDDTLARNQVARSQISGWILHPGGRDVLLALRERISVVRPRRALERRGVARTRQHEQPVRLVCAASRAGGRRAGRLVVDDLIRRRLQLPRRAARSGMNLSPMNRIVLPELLDVLPPQDAARLALAPRFAAGQCVDAASANHGPRAAREFAGAGLPSTWSNWARATDIFS